MSRRRTFLYNGIMKTLIEDIKTGQFKNVYLLYGEETYLIRQYREKLKAALTTEGDTMNTAFFSGKDTDPKELIDLSETMPFFAERRCIFVDGSGFFKKSTEELASYMEEIPTTTCFVFTEQEVDRRGKLYKQVKKAGRAVEFKRQPEKVLMQWILGRLGREGKKITRSVMELFLSRTGNDMELIDQEIEKARAGEPCFILEVANNQLICFIGIIILWVTGCAKPKTSLKAVDWNTMWVLNFALVVAAAVNSSGTGSFVADLVLELCGAESASYVVVLIAVCLIGGVLTQVMSNTATNAMFGPICISIALSLGISPLALCIPVMIIVNCAVISPLGSPCMTVALVGGYRAKDYLVVGLPLMFILIASGVLGGLLLYGI